MLRVYLSAISPTMMHGSETRSPPSTVMERLDRTERKLLKRPLGYVWPRRPRDRRVQRVSRILPNSSRENPQNTPPGPNRKFWFEQKIEKVGQSYLRGRHNSVKMRIISSSDDTSLPIKLIEVLVEMVLVKTSMVKNIDSSEQLTTRIGRLRMRRYGPTPALTIFAAYAPTSSYEEEEVEAFCMDLEKEAIKEDLKERGAEVLTEAAEAGKSIRYARRDFASRKTRMTALQNPEGTAIASRRGMEKIIYDFYSDLFDSHVHLSSHHLREDGQVIPEVLPSEIRHAIMSVRNRKAPDLDRIRP
ncbi:hypothetical protein RB195_019504 [Necator americanus]|uniref:Uncharacterized protein n=1 Tax=Necator americanus TaxID=51031 RepID=A0ABR1CEH9_NECAM